MSVPTSFVYYLSLEGISVGGKLLNIGKNTFSLQSDGTGSYDAVKEELASLIKLPLADGSKIG